jgi:hypothetical protein
MGASRASRQKSSRRPHLCASRRPEGNLVPGSRGTRRLIQSGCRLVQVSGHAGLMARSTHQLARHAQQYLRLFVQAQILTGGCGAQDQFAPNLHHDDDLGAGSANTDSPTAQVLSAGYCLPIGQFSATGRTGGIVHVVCLPFAGLPCPRCRRHSPLRAPPSSQANRGTAASFAECVQSRNRKNGSRVPV